MNIPRYTAGAKMLTYFLIMTLRALPYLVETVKHHSLIRSFDPREWKHWPLSICYYVVQYLRVPTDLFLPIFLSPLSRLDPPEIELETDRVHSGDNKEAHLTCLIHGNPTPKVRKEKKRKAKKKRIKDTESDQQKKSFPFIFGDSK